MSDLERNKGILIPVGVDTEHFTEEDFDTYRENGFMVLDGEVYEIKYEVESDIEVYFADIVENEDGTINFHTIHYNGGESLEEVIEDSLLKQG